MITPLDHHGLGAVRERFQRLYGAEADRCIRRFAMLCGRYGLGYPVPADPRRWNEQDAVLITYGDMVHAAPEKPLATLRRFLKEHLADAFNTVHVLPFFPYSSDEGFSVVHFRLVNPELGDWAHIRDLAQDVRLMADLVLNHVSRKSGWFHDFETGVAPGRDYFITASPKDALSAVVRPRSLPLLTPVQTREGLKHVWTTFSDDQMDLNFANPDVLFELLDILLYYVSTGARLIRLDAVAYLWKKIGTPCIHLQQTHEVVKLFRDLLGIVAPDVLLLTETNVPHEENIRYFGAGDEAHMVYQFSLPPLILHALTTGNARRLTDWAMNLRPPPPGCAFLNFTASHDGIGVRPLQGLVPEPELAALADHVKRNGGQVSMKRNSDGGESPYEFNISWWNAMKGPDAEDGALHEQRFISSQAIAMALQGIPALYFHTMTATPNDDAGVQRTGRARSINRRRWLEGELLQLLQDKDTRTHRIFESLKHLLKVRSAEPAFHPDAPQQVLALDERVFAVERRAPDDSHVVRAITNCTAAPVALPPRESSSGKARDLVTGKSVSLKTPLDLAPCQTVWLWVG